MFILFCILISPLMVIIGEKLDLRLSVARTANYNINLVYLYGKNLYNNLYSVVTNNSLFILFTKLFIIAVFLALGYSGLSDYKLYKRQFLVKLHLNGLWSKDDNRIMPLCANWLLNFNNIRFKMTTNMYFK